ncbi:5-bromo-4-chloroindolyl phosphate hydrolysis family protein [Falsibacillus albus]|nr:5-bromo-4-chloroindolyl phosphate hydrolysis family protein [Falsibacillus albus]
MKSFMRYIIRSCISTLSGIFIWLLSFFSWNIPFSLTSVLAISSSIAIYFIIKWMQTANIHKQYGLDRKEYAYIRQQLKESKQKIKKLNKSIFQLKSISAFRQFYETQKLSKQIFHTVKLKPQLFFSCEQFFYQHLDSAVEITEKYAALSANGLNDPSFRKTMGEAKEALSLINQSLNDDLIKLHSGDLHDLQVEIEYVKQKHW